MADRAFVDYCLDLLSSLGPVSARRMFGGHGLYAGDLMVALIASDTLYLKSDNETASAFTAAGCEAFSFRKRGRDEVVVTSYRSAPLDALDDPAAMAPWAAHALAAARRAQAGRKPRARRARVAQP